LFNGTIDNWTKLNLSTVYKITSTTLIQTFPNAFFSFWSNSSQDTINSEIYLSTQLNRLLAGEHNMLIGDKVLVEAVGLNKALVAFGCKISLTGPKGQHNLNILLTPHW